MDFKINHFVTVGTSLPRNFITVLGKCYDYPEECPLTIDRDDIRSHMDTLDRCLRIPPGSPSEIECISLLSGWSRLHDHLLEALSWDPKRMSAELNAMSPWIEYAERRDPAYVSTIHLYITESGSGILSGRILVEYLKKRLPNAKIESRIITGMRENIWLALRNLALKLGKDLSSVLKHDNSTENIILLNLTGGLKPEGAVALLEVARRTMNNAIAYYIHEVHRRPTPIPIITSSRQILQAKKLITPRIYNAGEYVEIPLAELDDDTRWLHYFAVAVEPLGLAKKTKEKILLATDIARMITQLEE